MDCNNHFLNILSSLDEPYFIAMSNKGTYKRAVKDLATMPNVKVEIAEETAKIQLEDETIVTFTGDIRCWACSCGARAICKHVIMALLGAKEMHNGEETKVDFSPLLYIDIRNSVSEKVWEALMFRTQFDLHVGIEEESMLLISFPEEEITVRFLTGERVEDAICTCKADGICLHKAEALYMYQKEKGVLHEDNEIRPLIMAPEKLAFFKKGIERIVHHGLSRLPESTEHELESLSVKARAVKMGKLENLLRKLATDIGLYRAKHIRFRVSSYRETLASIYEYVLLVEKHRIHEEAYRSAYYEMPPITLHGFGASSWQTKSGYIGVTYYFYYVEQMKWMTYTESRPVFYEESSVTAEQLYEKQAPWGLAGTGSELSRLVVRLKHAKLSTDFQLSSSSRTIGEQKGETNIAEWHSLFLDSWEDVLEKVKRCEERVYCIEMTEVGEWTLQKQEQKWTLPLLDKLGNILHMHVIKRPDNDRFIRTVKKYMKTSKTKRMLVRLYNENGKLGVEPIVFYKETGEVVNITLGEGDDFYNRTWPRY